MTGIQPISYIALDITESVLIAHALTSGATEMHLLFHAAIVSLTYSIAIYSQKLGEISASFMSHVAARANHVRLHFITAF